MAGLMKKAVLGASLAATALAAAAPAEAQRWRRYDRGDDVATGAIIGGLVGLGIGAAIAANDRDRFYDRGFYDDRAFYDDRYYRNDFYRPRYRQRCVTRFRFDPYYGQRVPVQICR